MSASSRSEEVILKKSARGYFLLFKQYLVVMETMKYAGIPSLISH